MKPFWKETSWKYLVLDEGHLIKNPNLKLTDNINALDADHKLILTGTPIQNSLWEIFSLFNFLMPGYLGPYAEFRNRYVKPIISLKSKVKLQKMDSEIEGNFSSYFLYLAISTKNFKKLCIIYQLFFNLYYLDSITLNQSNR